MENTPNQNPEPSPTAPAPKKPKKTLLTAIIAIVVVVIVVVAVVLVTIPSLTSHSPSSPSPHFGFVSLSTVEYYANNTTLTESSVITVTVYSSVVVPAPGLVKAEEVFFNSSTFGRMILIVVAQFSNSSSATNFFLQEMKTKVTFSVPYINSSYDSFNYSYAPKSVINIPEGIALGISNNFVFNIVDAGVPVPNFNGLIQAQISAMVQ